MSTVDDFALQTQCPACGAEPGYWCVTYRPTVRPAGRLTGWLHQPRTPLHTEQQIHAARMQVALHGGPDVAEILAMLGLGEA